MKTKRRPKIGIRPLHIVIALAALLLAVYAAVQHFDRRAEIGNDPHYGMVEVFNGESYVWIVPEEDVPKNTFEKDDFATDPEGNLTYVGGEYKASRGVDVSQFQGDIDWQAVYDSGVRFAVLRVGGRYYGSGELYSDDRFLENLEEARAAGLRVGAYFFSQAISVEEAREEARYVLELIGDRELDLPVFFDWERIVDSDARTHALDNETLTECAVTFCEEMKAAGFGPGVYVYNDTGYHGYDLSRLQDYMLWCVGVGSYPYFYYAHTVWQYSFRGAVPGINGDCDLNMMFEK
ncbi:MAG: glycoside hydrolase family 25 protein [Oscillospiraceae bacterium]|nr:glycoside hydrolase family 25 protein [Oscillospiraceae bacterium]